MQALVDRLERIAQTLEVAFPVFYKERELAPALAYRWESIVQGGRSVGRLAPLAAPNLISFKVLKNIDEQKAQIEQNTRQFVKGLPANNVLLTGARGTGKSSLVKACLHAFHAEGLRMIEVDKEHLNDLPYILNLIHARPERFIVFCDDLSFEEGETQYKGLKTVLDGSLSSPSSNLLIYATSNRRHLVPEQMADNQTYRHTDDGEIHPGDVIEEKIALSDRFGLWIPFYTFTQDQYLAAVAQWLASFGFSQAGIADVRQAALQWALQRGSRSGRIASQFARDYAGRHQLSHQEPSKTQKGS